MKIEKNTEIKIYELLLHPSVLFWRSGNYAKLAAPSEERLISSCSHRGLTQEVEGNNMGAGSSWPERTNHPGSYCVNLLTLIKSSKLSSHLRCSQECQARSNSLKWLLKFKLRCFWSSKPSLTPSIWKLWSQGNTNIRSLQDLLSPHLVFFTITPIHYVWNTICSAILPSSLDQFLISNLPKS